MDEGCSRSVCEDRPEHPSDRTLRQDRRPPRQAHPHRTATPTDRRRATHPGRGPGLLGIRSEARWLRFLPRHLPGAFPYLPQQSGYNKRLRNAVPLLKHVIRMLAVDTDLWTDATWIIDSTPVECARSREAAKRSELAGWAGYGYCSSHSRFFGACACT